MVWAGFEEEGAELRVSAVRSCTDIDILSEGGREGGEGGREGGRERGREGEREGGREGGRE